VNAAVKILAINAVKVYVSDPGIEHHIVTAHRYTNPTTIKHAADIKVSQRRGVCEVLLTLLD
jgi:hypothetical protein